LPLKLWINKSIYLSLQINKSCKLPLVLLIFIISLVNCRVENNNPCWEDNLATILLERFGVLAKFIIKHQNKIFFFWISSNNKTITSKQESWSWELESNTNSKSRSKKPKFMISSRKCERHLRIVRIGQEIDKTPWAAAKVCMKRTRTMNEFQEWSSAVFLNKAKMNYVHTCLKEPDYYFKTIIG